MHKQNLSSLLLNRMSFVRSAVDFFGKGLPEASSIASSSPIAPSSLRSTEAASSSMHAMLARGHVYKRMDPNKVHRRHDGLGYNFQTPEPSDRVGLTNCRAALRILYDERKEKWGGVVRLSAERLEAGKRAASRVLNREGFIRMTTAATLPLTTKPLGVRMGRGKGEITKMVAVPRPGQIIMEIHGAKTHQLAVAALRAARYKLAVPCRVETEVRARGEMLLEEDAAALKAGAA